jgi:hypothetical protein
MPVILIKLIMICGAPDALICTSQPMSAEGDLAVQIGGSARGYQPGFA